MKFIFVALLVSISFRGSAQADTTVDMFGNLYRLDITINRILNYKGNKLVLKDLKGKAVLFDFGNVKCHGCVEHLPELDSMQRRYQRLIQIFWVTNSTEAEVHDFLKNNPIGKKMTIPIICEDTILNTLLKSSKSYPYLYWIDSYGNIVAETNPYFGISSEMVKLSFDNFKKYTR